MKRADQSTIRYAVSRIPTGAAHVCVQGDTEVACFGGSNDHQQLGGALAGSEATKTGLPLGVLGLAAGADHTCAILQDTSIRCWGLNASGQYGDGTTVTPELATLVPPKGT